MQEAAIETTDEPHATGTRIDWRTGKPMVQRDEAFWREHERRRVELGMGVRRYCDANGLALSTYRHRVNGKKCRSAKAPAASSTTATSPAFLAVTAPPAADAAAAVLEIAVEGMTMRLRGAAAERVLARVMDRLA